LVDAVCGHLFQLTFALGGSAWLLIHPEIVLPWTKEPNFDFRDRVSIEAKRYLKDLHAGQERDFGGVK
jgi:hypothetical protein